MIYEIKGQKFVDISNKDIIKIICNELLQKNIEIVSKDDFTIIFTSPFMQFGWNIFSPVSCGLISLKKEKNYAVLTYKISLFRVRVFAVLSLLMMITVAIISGDMFFIFAGLFMGGGLYGMNYLTSLNRLSIFFDLLVKRAT